MMSNYSTPMPNPPPVIRCTFLGTNEKFLFCKATETHQLRLDREPVFSIFKDQQVVTSGGDFLVKLRSVESGNAVFPHAVQPGGISATLSRDSIISTPVVDKPPKAFISGVCDVTKYYLVIGCPDQPAIPTITTSDLLLEGGLDSISEKKQLIDLFVRILTFKYLAQSDNPLAENPDRITACRRAKYIVENHCIHRDFSTLLWHDGLQTRDGSRTICSLLQGESFNPSLIAICSGPTVFTSDEDFFDVNPALYPVNLFDQVSIIRGCVNVSNKRPSGKFCHLGSGNAVKFAIGRVARVVANPWDLPSMFPALVVIDVEGVSPNGPIYDPDSDNGSLSNLKSSLVLVCKSRAASQLRNSMLSGGYFRKCEILRSGGSSRTWTSLLGVPTEYKVEERNSLLSKRHFFQIAPSVYNLSSREANGAALVQCGSKFAFQKNNPTALDILHSFGRDSGISPTVIPVGDFFFKVILEPSLMSKLVATLRAANHFLRVNLFIYIRHGGEEIRLTRNSESKTHHSKGLKSGRFRDRSLLRPLGYPLA